MDSKLLEVLTNSNHLVLYPHFAGLTLDELTNNLSCKNLKAKLIDVLQAVEENRARIVQSITAEILKTDAGETEDDNQPVVWMELELLDVLAKCGALQLYHHFITFTKEGLADLPIKQLGVKLRIILPPEQDRDSLIQKIMLALWGDGDENGGVAFGEQHEAVSSTEEDPSEITIKIEPCFCENVDQVLPSNEDDEVQIVEINVPMVRNIPTLSVGDEDENEDGDNMNVDNEVDNVEPEEQQEINPGHNYDNSDSNLVNKSNEDNNQQLGPLIVHTESTNPQRKRIKKPVTPSSSRSSQLNPRSNPAPNNSLSKKGPIQFSYENDDIIDRLKNSPSPHVVFGKKTKFTSWSKWNELCSDYGSKIEAVDLVDWTWRPIGEKCRLNLAFILTKVCPQLKKLNILSECQFPATSAVIKPPLNLEKLATLKIDHNGLLNYTDQLTTILIATNGKLRKIEFLYQDEVALCKFLNILQSLEPHQLAKLRSLSIQKRDGEHVALVSSDVEAIANIKAKRLEELDLGFGFWDDTKPALEALLRNFSHLKTFKAQGSFITMEKTEPIVVINFPRMPLLQVLDLGGNYEFVSIIESIYERPAKRKIKKGGNIHQENDNPGTLPLPPPPSHDEEDDADTRGDYFTVTLNLPELPALTSLQLGSSYDLVDLHFKKMPKLEVFRVASNWHLAVTFPPSTSRNFTYPNLKELQIPDFFQDDSFLPKISTHFPSLEKVYIYLPTVKVLRRFAKLMENVDSFKHLELKIQFDFASSLKSCFLHNPYLEPQSTEEMRQIRVLKEYTYWKEYVITNKIELPDFETQEEEEDASNYSGLHVLKDKLSSFKMFHIPRTLRLPSGSLHWNHDECEFSPTLIGFEESRYPLSQLVFDQLPKNAKFYLFYTSDIQSKELDTFKFKKPRHSCHLDSSIMEVEAKEEVRAEADVTSSTTRQNSMLAPVPPIPGVMLPQTKGKPVVNCVTCPF